MPTQYVKTEIRIEAFRSVYYFEHDNQFYHTPEQHNSWEMVYVDRGSIVAITDGVGCELEEGQAIFHEPNEIHAHVSNGQISNNMFVVSFICDSPAMSFFKKKTFTLDKTSKTLLKLFMEEAQIEIGPMQKSYTNRKLLAFNYETFGTTQLMANYFEEFLIKLVRGGGDKIQASSQSRQIAKNSTVELIEAHLKQNIYQNFSMSDICKQFNLSKSQLSLIFKENTGKSIMQYYTDLKMDEAKKLLRDDKLSVGEIADRIGYSDIHSFSRSFKLATGFSPTGYKGSIL